MKAKLRINGEERDIDIVRQGDQLRITIDGAISECRLCPQRRCLFVLEHDNRRLRAAGLANGDKRHLWHNGHIFSYERVQAAGGALLMTPQGSLSASIPAVVTQVLVQIRTTHCSR